MSSFDDPLCGCFSDICSCLVSCCLPLGVSCVQACAVDKSLDSGMCKSFIHPCILMCIGSAINRGKIRSKYMIEGSFVGDCLVSFFCSPCAVTQEYREVKRREGI